MLRPSPLVVKVNAAFHDQQKRILIVTSDGVKVEDLQPRSYLTASVIAEKNGKRERAGWNFGGRRDFSYFTPALVDELAQERGGPCHGDVRRRQPPAGEMPVVLGPGVTGILLHEAIGHGMEADFNRKKISTYSTMIGKKVAEPQVTIIDDGTIPNLLGSINIDDEGTPGQKTVLVDKGILTSYMHDKISARFYNVNPPATGGGRATSTTSSRACATPTCWPARPPPTRSSRAWKGHLHAGRQQRPGEDRRGRFRVLRLAGTLIEDGKLTAPIKDVNIMGNGPKMLTNVTMVANDLEMFQGGTGACGKGGQAVPVGFGQPDHPREVDDRWRCESIKKGEQI